MGRMNAEAGSGRRAPSGYLVKCADCRLRDMAARHLETSAPTKVFDRRRKYTRVGLLFLLGERCSCGWRSLSKRSYAQHPQLLWLHALKIP